MKKVKVIEVERYRDGGTIVYQDELNRRYYQWYPTKKVYNQMPVWDRISGTEMNPNVKEINVELEIVNAFN